MVATQKNSDLQSLTNEWERFRFQPDYPLPRPLKSMLHRVSTQSSMNFPSITSTLIWGRGKGGAGKGNVENVQISRLV